MASGKSNAKESGHLRALSVRDRSQALPEGAWCFGRLAVESCAFLSDLEAVSPFIEENRRLGTLFNPLADRIQDQRW